MMALMLLKSVVGSRRLANAESFWLVSKVDGQCLTSEFATYSTTVRECSDEPAQQWSLANSQLKSLHDTSRCLYASAYGSSIYMSMCDDVEYAKWYFVDQGQGQGKLLRSGYDDRCLSAAGNGGKPILQVCGATNDQTWLMASAQCYSSYKDFVRWPSEFMAEMVQFEANLKRIARSKGDDSASLSALTGNISGLLEVQTVKQKEMAALQEKLQLEKTRNTRLVRNSSNQQRVYQARIEQLTERLAAKRNDSIMLANKTNSLLKVDVAKDAQIADLKFNLSALQEDKETLLFNLRELGRVAEGLKTQLQAERNKSTMFVDKSFRLEIENRELMIENRAQRIKLEKATSALAEAGGPCTCSQEKRRSALLVKTLKRLIDQEQEMVRKCHLAQVDIELPDVEIPDLKIPDLNDTNSLEGQPTPRPSSWKFPKATQKNGMLAVLILAICVGLIVAICLMPCPCAQKPTEAGHSDSEGSVGESARLIKPDSLHEDEQHEPGDGKEKDDESEGSHIIVLERKSFPAPVSPVSAPADLLQEAVGIGGSTPPSSLNTEREDASKNAEGAAVNAEAEAAEDRAGAEPTAEDKRQTAIGKAAQALAAVKAEDERRETVVTQERRDEESKATKQKKPTKTWQAHEGEEEEPYAEDAEEDY